MPTPRNYWQELLTQLCGGIKILAKKEPKKIVQWVDKFLLREGRKWRYIFMVEIIRKEKVDISYLMPLLSNLLDHRILPAFQAT